MSLPETMVQIPDARPVSRPSMQAIQEPVREELIAFKRYFREAMRNRHGLLDKVLQYIFRQKGKRIRPTLVLLAAKTCGSIEEATYRGAALVELLHTATLVHDDVVDDAERRRGVFSINAVWKNKIAVLVGDFILSRGLLLALDHRDYAQLHELSDAVRRMSEGELLQIEKARKLDIDEATYFDIIRDKTASLISASTAIGAQSVVTDEEVVTRMRSFGENLGVAFQIRDDLFDFGVQDVGKPIGIDLQEKKLTLPLIYALRVATASERKEIMKIVKLKKKSTTDIRRVSTFVESHGGIEYARQMMDEFAQQAKTDLADLPDSPARASLFNLVDYTVFRKH